MTRTAATRLRQRRTTRKSSKAESQKQQIQRSLLAAVEQLKEPFRELLAVKEESQRLDYLLSEKRKHVTPLFWLAYKTWLTANLNENQASGHQSLAFVEFVQLLNPSVPRHTAGYKEDETWLEADYLLHRRAR